MDSAHKSKAIEALDKLYEFEQEPVSEDKLQPGRYFAASYGGEHVAGTEFVIGALFVAWGATASNIFLGLLVGNLMAVLTWTFVCAPISVQTRLTLYWYLRRIAGPVTTTIYNVLNAVLFCILAGCMITVSASAVRIPFGIPEQTKWYPQDIRFVVIAILVGAVVVTLAILGFKRLAQFAEICVPWMFFMFIAGAIAMLPGLAQKVIEHPITSLQDFWEIANKSIWTGVRPDGSKPIGFWHVAAFAWICNLAMHGGLSDMALLRYAKKASYGLYSAFGMFLGHYLAWVCAGIMGAAAAIVVGKTISQMDAGGVAWQALGVSGIIAVILAGWTTSNPTLYRAGLAFQAVTPGWPRWLVTLVAGIVTTVMACFPFVFVYLLNFVGYYGLLLMPVGAIVFVEHWIFPKVGLTQFWASRKKLLVSWPALLSWGIAIAVAMVIQKEGPVYQLFRGLADFLAGKEGPVCQLFRGLADLLENGVYKLGFLHLFFLFLPTWFITAILYTVFAAMAGAREKLPELVLQPLSKTAYTPAEQKSAVKKTDTVVWFWGIMAFASLFVCLMLPIWVYFSPPDAYQKNLVTFKSVLLWPTLIHFVSAVAWAIKKEKAM
jgi:NCS1 family nucleobase:cation symporter-1